MSLSIYAHAPAQFIRGLRILSELLHKGESYLKDKQLDEGTLLEARLAPDMFPLLRQVQIVSDTSKGAAARLSGREVPSMPDTETSFAELQQRIEKTIACLREFSAEDFAGSEGRTIVMKAKDRELTFNAQDYLLNFAIPNFYFHLTTAYDILRHRGVDVGKMDYLGAL